MQRCATHAYSLIGKGLSGVDFIKDALKGCAAMGAFIVSHSHVREELKKAGAKELLQAAETRFLRPLRARPLRARDYEFYDRVGQLVSKAVAV